MSFDSRLEPEQYARYRTAHRCAARYCRQLERRFVQRGEARVEALVRELRQFLSIGDRGEVAPCVGLTGRGDARREKSYARRFNRVSSHPTCFFSLSHSLNLRRSFFLRGASAFANTPLS